MSNVVPFQTCPSKYFRDGARRMKTDRENFFKRGDSIVTPDGRFGYVLQASDLFNNGIRLVLVTVMGARTSSPSAS